MPKKIIVEQFMIEMDSSDERIIKTSISLAGKDTIILEKGFGKIHDLLYTNDTLIARTDKGWFFSKDIGESWKNEDAWKLENPEFFMKKDYEYFFMESVLKKLMQNQPNLIKSNNLIWSDCLQKKVTGQVDIIEVTNQLEENLLRSSIHETLFEYKLRKFLYFTGNETEETLAESIHQLHEKKELLRNRSLLDNVIHESMFLKGPDLTNLYNFEQTLRDFKIKFDIKTVFIGDIYNFFQKDKSPDFIESTFNLLCEACYYLNIRIIVVLNLERLDELQGIILPKTFRNPIFKRYIIEREEPNNEIAIRPKDEF